MRSFYPTSDGQPMAETDLHAASMVYVACALRWVVREARTGRRVRRLEQLPVLRAGQSRRGGGAGRVRGSGGAGASSRHIHAVERAEGAGLRPGGDVEEHARHRRAAQARGLRGARGAGVLPLRPEGGVPDAAVAGLAIAPGRVPCAAGGDGAVEPRDGGGKRGAGASSCETSARRGCCGCTIGPPGRIFSPTGNRSWRARKRPPPEEAATRKAAEVRAGQAEVRAGREAEARAAAEAKVAELQAQLRALQDERARNGNGRP